MKKIYINNNFVNEKEAMISVYDRGFRFGDGVFETIRIYNKKLYNLKAHLTRLRQGISDLKIKIAENRITHIENIAKELIKINDIYNGILRISITRGVGSVGYLPNDDNLATMVIEANSSNNTDSFPEFNHDGVLIGISDYQKISQNSLPVRSKISANLNSVLAKIEAREKNLFDVILLDSNSYICETSSANIFWYQNNKLYTPKNNILLGTIRAKIIELQKDIEITEGDFKLSDTLSADEIFITNSNILVMPVRALIIEQNEIIFKQNIVSKQIFDLLINDIRNAN